MLLSISGTAQTVVGNISTSDSKNSCTTDQPSYKDANGKPIWLDTESLLKGVRHCAAPNIDSLGDIARIEGYVSVDILVNDTGKVSCVRLVSGHPLLATSAINAAKDWSFQPKMKDAKPVWFYGHLRFHYSSSESAKGENPCTVAHW
jgi:TonB family protein